MERLALIRIGGGAVASGLWPLDAGSMLKDLIAGFRQFGGAAETWEGAELHLEITGSGSTQAAIVSPFARALMPAVKDFCESAADQRLCGRAYEFVFNNFKAGAPWRYLDVAPAGEDARKVRFDSQYRERLIARQTSPVVGSESIYARVIRVGGKRPPTAKLEVMGHGPLTVELKSEDALEIAKRLGENLYETVSLEGTASWNPATFKLERFVIEKINEDWQDVSLAEVIADNGGILPIKLSVDSEPALVRERTGSRRQT